MKLTIPLLSFLIPLLLITSKTLAQDAYGTLRKSWLQKVEAAKPVLKETVKYPLALVELQKDSLAFQGWKTVNTLPPDSLYNTSFKKLQA